ncbi:uncharacterized protein I303_103873 [Kwoniella dejecticola CBS 10117]|uniref:Ricin B lectin domain-containing protein n=1 Tax=Kwoniella dejecticola CBS 10117 TaxID=1296121 RepID=A0A1A6A7Z1_9TREE|nr:uncharacterized protein I303_03892 [Kwoniella dejecticola CBS 10117]OBR86172.1 hypothetical protein I303_03892 [Kwoniella dejecticola CBS 10117]
MLFTNQVVLYTITFLYSLTLTSNSIFAFGRSSFVNPKPVKRQYRELGVYISSIRDGSCLSTTDEPAQIGSKVVFANCEGAETWHVPNEAGLLGLDTVGLVLDQNDEDGLYLREPVKNSSSQLWKWRSDNRLSSADNSLCLQHSQGGPQPVECDSMNVDQVWILRNTSRAQTFDDIAKQPDVNRNGFIHPYGRNDICLSAVSAKEAFVGGGIAMTYCSGKGDGNSYLPVSTSDSLFTWNLPAKGQRGHVKLSSKNLCLETGYKTYNVKGYWEWSFMYGMGIQLKECDDSIKGQDWIWDGKTLKIAEGDSNQCLNILGRSGPVQMSNFLNLRPMQLWTCDPNDQNSMFSAS